MRGFRVKRSCEIKMRYYYVLSFSVQVFSYRNPIFRNPIFRRRRTAEENSETEKPPIDQEILWNDLSIADAIAKVIFKHKIKI